MAFDYAPLAAESLALLTEYGQDVVCRAYSQGTYDPATGTTTPVTADTTRKGALFDFGAGQTLERGSMVQGSDKRLLVDATAAVSPQDHFIVSSTDYSIVSVGEVNPAGTRVLYDLHVRVGA